MHRRPPSVVRTLRGALLTDRMLRTPRQFVHDLIRYDDDPDVHLGDFETFLPVGSVAPDFTLDALTGAPFSLADHRGAYVVLEFGSYTCPMYRRQIPEMAALAREYADDDRITFALVYGPEAHPDQGKFRGIEQPETIGERRALAERLVAEADVPMPVLLDDLPRRVSTLYGGAPNMVYVVGPAGRVVYRDRWTDAPSIGRFLRPVLGATARD